jgi:hypothetical protein
MRSRIIPRICYNELKKAYRAMYVFKKYAPNDKFTSNKVIEINFKLYEEMLPLQQWVYELTLTT